MDIPPSPQRSPTSPYPASGISASVHDLGSSTRPGHHADERPALLGRSVSTPHVPVTPTRGRLGRGHRTIHGGATPVTPKSIRPGEDRWSVFGQLMTDDRTGTVLRSASLRRPPQPPDTLQIRIPERVDTYPDIPDVLHSPTSLLSPTRSLRRRTTYFDPDTAGENADASSLDDTSDSDEEESATPTQSHFAPPPPAPSPSIWSRLSSFKVPEMPLLYRNVLKCAIAYFIASLFTFTPVLSMLIHDLTPWTGDRERKPSPSAHMVATVAVYFNPAKTLGGMFEADFFCFIGIAYSIVVCLLSLLMFRGVRHLSENPHPDYNSDVVIGLVHLGIIFYIGIAMSVIAFMKVHLNKPSFNTACSMTVIIMFVVLIREASPSKLANAAIIAIIGAITSNLVNWFIWPTSATKNLQTNMVKTLDSFRVLLEILTNSFLLEEEDEDGAKKSRFVSPEKLQKAVEAHQSSFTSLKKNLDEAKSEWRVIGGGGAPSVSSSSRRTSYYPARPNYTPHPSRRHTTHIVDEHESIWDRLWDTRKQDSEVRTSRRAYEDAVDSLNRLAQHLNGLRSGNRMLMQLTNEDTTVHKGDDESDTVDILEELVEELSPPLRALSTTCTGSLKTLREAFVQSHSSHKRSLTSSMSSSFFQGNGERASTLGSSRVNEQTFEELVTEISRALVRFDSTSNHALLRLYRRSANASEATEDGVEDEVSEDLFVVYFFLFTLQEFSRELVSLIDAMERIYVNEQIRLSRGSVFRRLFVHLPRRVFVDTPRRIWRLATGADGVRKHGSMRQAASDLRRRITLKRSASALGRARRQAPPKPFFPKVQPHAPNTIQTPYKDLNWTGRVKARIWALGEGLKSRNVKYAFKAGMCTAILAAPGFFEVTRPWFLDFYGDWALISYFIVISPTIGATNNLSWHRIFGTVLGASVAAAIFTLFPEQPIILAIFGFFFSIPCFYYIVATPKYVSAGRFVLLTYNLTCLYCYNVRDRDLSATFVATRRSIAVVGGVLWAALVSRVWWPSEARRELGASLSEFCLNIGWLYTRLVASNSYSPEYREEEEFGQNGNEEEEPNERTALIRKPNTTKTLKKNSNTVEEFMAMELHLQVKLIELQGLLAQTQHEPRLKGPFPVARYRTILTSLQTILDRLHSMRCVTTKEEWYTSVRKDFIIPVNKERREMVGNIILSFSILASSFRTKAPLPPYLPPAEKSRQALVDAIKRLAIVRSRDIKGSRQLLFFAYALTMKGVTVELESLGKLLQNIFGVIGGAADEDEFEEMFSVDEGTRGIERGE